MMQLASVPITVGDATTVVPGGQSSGYGKKNGTMAVPLSVAPKGPRSLLARHTAPPAVRLRYSSPRRAVCVAVFVKLEGHEKSTVQFCAASTNVWITPSFTAAPATR